MERSTDERHEMKRSRSLRGESFNYVRQRATCYLEVWLLSECNYVAFEIRGAQSYLYSMLAIQPVPRIISLNTSALKDAFLLSLELYAVSSVTLIE